MNKRNNERMKELENEKKKKNASNTISLTALN